MRRSGTAATSLPATEALLADLPHHLIPRGEADMPNPDFGFKVDVPEHLYNQGEIHNLTVRHGTLTAEERYQVDEHITHDLMMPDRMPLRKPLSRFPEYDAAHHRALNGASHARQRRPDELSEPARTMLIAATSATDALNAISA